MNQARINMEAEFSRLFENAQKPTLEDLKLLQDADDELEMNPSFLAEFVKDKFIDDVLHQMRSLGLTQGELSKRMGKTRQYLNKVLNRSKPTNFTVQTMAEISMAVNMHLSVSMTSKSMISDDSDIWVLQQMKASKALPCSKEDKNYATAKKNNIFAGKPHPHDQKVSAA